MVKTKAAKTPVVKAAKTSVKAAITNTRGKENRKEVNQEEEEEEDLNDGSSDDDSANEKTVKEPKTVAGEGQVELVVYNNVIMIDGKKCLRQGTAANNPCTMSVVGTGDLYKSLCIHEIGTMNLGFVESKIKEIIKRNRGWRTTSADDKSKLDEFFLMTSERIDANKSAARASQKHNKKATSRIDMISVLEPLNTVSLEAFVELNQGNKKGVKLIVAVVLDGKVSTNADALKGSGSSVSKDAFADRLKAAVRSLSGQLYEWHKLGSQKVLTADVERFKSYLIFNGDQKTKGDSVNKFLNICKIQILKKQGELPQYEELRVSSNVEDCKDLIFKLAEKINAEQLNQHFGTAISKPGQLIEIDDANNSQDNN